MTRFHAASYEAQAENQTAAPGARQAAQYAHAVARRFHSLRLMQGRLPFLYALTPRFAWKAGYGAPAALRFALQRLAFYFQPHKPSGIKPVSAAAQAMRDHVWVSAKQLNIKHEDLDEEMFERIVQDIIFEALNIFGA